MIISHAVVAMVIFYDKLPASRQPICDCCYSTRQKSNSNGPEYLVIISTDTKSKKNCFDSKTNR